MQYNVIYFTQTVEYIGRSEAFYCVPAVDYISMVKTLIKIPKVEFKLEHCLLMILIDIFSTGSRVQYK